MEKLLRALIVEDSETDAELMVHELRRGGLATEWERVETEATMRAALDNGNWDVILCDHNLPRFDASAVLDILKNGRFDIPVIVISGIVDMARVKPLIKAGADDFVDKNDLARLVPSVERTLRDARLREERKQTLEALRRAKEQTEFANRAKTEFLTNMSHELRTPLNSILGFSEVLATGVLGPMGKPEYQEYAKIIHESGTHLLALINDLMDISMIESGVMHMDETPLEVGQVVDACQRIVRGRAKEAGLELAVEVAPSLPALLADGRQVKQIFLNLLSNAIKFTPSGGKVTVKAALDDRGGHVVSVSDTGIGIAPEDMETVLSAFGQADGTLTRQYEGAGLGLPLTRGLVELHGGTLELESEPGKGTTVRIRFPKDRTASA